MSVASQGPKQFAINKEVRAVLRQLAINRLKTNKEVIIQHDKRKKCQHYLTCDCFRDFCAPKLKALRGMYGGGAPVSSSGGTFQPYTSSLTPNDSRSFSGRFDLLTIEHTDCNLQRHSQVAGRGADKISMKRIIMRSKM